MASKADVDAFRSALRNLSKLAARDLATLWLPVAGADFRDQRRVLDSAWPELIGTYGDLGSVVAADMLDEWVEGVAVDIVRPVDDERALSRMRWAIGTDEPYGNLSLILDELVKQPARSTIARTAESNGLRWARVPTGAETCSFCLMLASRGDSYQSQESAGYGRKYHGDCDCTPIPVKSAADFPDGYDPDALFQKYQDARDAARSGDTKTILSELRATEGIH